MNLKTFGWVAVIGLCFANAGCSGGDTKEAVAEDSVKVVEEYAAAIESVKDEASAKAAAAKIDDLSARMKKIGERSKAVKVTKAENDALMKTYKSRMDAAQSKMMSGMMRVMVKPELSKHIEAANQRFMTAAQQIAASTGMK